MPDAKNAPHHDQQGETARAVLQARDVRKAYPTAGEPVQALRGVSLTAHAGEFLAIMGASGSGKSTLLHLIAGLDQPTAGSIVIDGHDLDRMGDRERTLFRRRHLGIVFQAYNLLETMTAEENVAIPALLDGVPRRAARDRAARLLDQVKLGHRTGHQPAALSGGEQQRVAIARAMMNNPSLLVADEPTGNLDTTRSRAVWQLLQSLVRDDGRTVIAVTHEAAGASFADRVIMLKDGTIAGHVEPGGDDHATLVATRYRELAG